MLAALWIGYVQAGCIRPGHRVANIRLAAVHKSMAYFKKKKAFFDFRPSDLRSPALTLLRKAKMPIVIPEGK